MKLSILATLGLLTLASAISCGDQAGSKGARCVAAGKNCPKGFRPVFYDDPKPCKKGQRCCVQ